LLKLKTNSEIASIVSATQKADSVINDERFWFAMHASFLGNFKDSNADVSTIRNIFTGSSIEASICTYRPWNPFKNELAMFDLRRPFDINLNVWKIKRTEASLVGSIIHEAIHLLDLDQKNYYFGHPFRGYRVDAHAPYVFGSVAKTFVENN
jgi:hypothetical protein